LLRKYNASVDEDTEAIMQSIIDSEFKHATVLSIIHRLEHIHQYDQVILLENGELVEYGNPRILLGADTKLANLYRTHGNARSSEALR
jgi:ATP-binding cassette, subfamily C (CFTR/MRP), member 1